MAMTHSTGSKVAARPQQSLRERATTAAQASGRTASGTISAAIHGAIDTAEAFPFLPTAAATSAVAYGLHHLTYTSLPRKAASTLAPYIPTTARLAFAAASGGPAAALPAAVASGARFFGGPSAEAAASLWAHGASPSLVGVAALGALTAAHTPNTLSSSEAAQHLAVPAVHAVSQTADSVAEFMNQPLSKGTPPFGYSAASSSHSPSAEGTALGTMAKGAAWIATGLPVTNGFISATTAKCVTAATGIASAFALLNPATASVMSTLVGLGLARDYHDSHGTTADGVAFNLEHIPTPQQPADQSCGLRALFQLNYMRNAHINFDKVIGALRAEETQAPTGLTSSYQKFGERLKSEIDALKEARASGNAERIERAEAAFNKSAAALKERAVTHVEQTIEESDYQRFLENQQKGLNHTVPDVRARARTVWAEAFPDASQDAAGPVSAIGRDGMTARDVGAFAKHLGLKVHTVGVQPSTDGDGFAPLTAALSDRQQMRTDLLSGEPVTFMVGSGNHWRAVQMRYDEAIGALGDYDNVDIRVIDSSCATRAARVQNKAIARHILSQIMASQPAVAPTEQPAAAPTA